MYLFKYFRAIKSADLFIDFIQETPKDFTFHKIETYEKFDFGNITTTITKKGKADVYKKLKRFYNVRKIKEYSEQVSVDLGRVSVDLGRVSVDPSVKELPINVIPGCTEKAKLWGPKNYCSYFISSIISSIVKPKGYNYIILKGHHIKFCTDKSITCPKKGKIIIFLAPKKLKKNINLLKKNINLLHDLKDLTPEKKLETPPEKILETPSVKKVETPRKKTKATRKKRKERKKKRREERKKIKKMKTNKVSKCECCELHN